MTLLDKHGHRWPITGFTCDACGFPLHASQARYKRHPTCQEDTDGS